MVTTNVDRRSTGNLISNARLIERSQRRCSLWWYQILCKQNVKAFKCMCPPRHGKVFLRGHQQVTRQKTPPPSQYLTEVGLFCKMFDKIIIIQRYASPFIIHFYVHKKTSLKYIFIQLLIITISLNNRYTNININIYYIYKPNISRGK